MHWFKGRYPIYLGNGQTLVVTSLEAAREAMIHQGWRKRKGRAYERAVELVLEGASDDIAVVEAAFAKAAKACDVLVTRENE